MRDQRFVAAHRGGLLSLEHHCLLMTWACACAEHVLPLYGGPVHSNLEAALETGRAWARGEVPTGAVMRASVTAHAVARGERADGNAVAEAVARAVGQAVATGHAADHSLGGAWYALKAVKRVGASLEVERAWQDQHLPLEVRALVLEARGLKGI
jgi:hypothetical protein